MAFDVSFVYKLQDQISSKLKNISKNFKDVEEAGKKAALGTSQRFKDLNKKIEGLGKSLRNKVTLPLLGVGTVSAVAFAKMETGLVNINNLLSKEELKEFNEDLQRLQKQALRAGFSIEDANKGLFDTVSALGASKESFKAFEVAQRLAVGGNTDLAVAVDGITSIMNVYGKTTTDATEVANAFFSSQVKGKTTVAELSSAIGQVAPIGKAAGVGFKELLSAMSALTTGGLSTDEAATSLKGALSALIKPTAEAGKILKKMDIPFGAANIKANGLANTLRSLTEAQNKYGTDAIAKAIPNIRAFTAVTALDEKALTSLDATIEKINSDMKTGDGLVRAYADQQDTLTIAAAKARGELTVAGNQLALSMKPALIALTKIITKLANKFAELSPRTRKFIVIFGAMAAVLGPLLILIAGIGAAITALGAPFVAISATITALIALLTTFYDKLAALKEFVTGGGLVNKLVGLKNKIFGDDAEINQTLNKNINSASTFKGNLDINVKAPEGTTTNLQIPENTAKLPVGVNSIMAGG